MSRNWIAVASAEHVRNWGYQFRFGLFSISDHDMNVIAPAMGADFTR